MTMNKLAHQIRRKRSDKKDGIHGEHKDKNKLLKAFNQYKSKLEGDYYYICEVLIEGKSVEVVKGSEERLTL